MKGTDREKESGKSVLAVRLDEDDDNTYSKPSSEHLV